MWCSLTNASHRPLVCACRFPCVGSRSAAAGCGARSGQLAAEAGGGQAAGADKEASKQEGRGGGCASGVWGACMQGKFAGVVCERGARENDFAGPHGGFISRGRGHLAAGISRRCKRRMLKREAEAERGSSRCSNRAYHFPYPEAYSEATPDLI